MFKKIAVFMALLVALFAFAYQPAAMAKGHHHKHHKTHKCKKHHGQSVDKKKCKKKGGGNKKKCKKKGQSVDKKKKCGNKKKKVCKKHKKYPPKKCKGGVIRARNAGFAQTPSSGSNAGALALGTILLAGLGTAGALSLTRRRLVRQSRN